MGFPRAAQLRGQPGGGGEWPPTHSLVHRPDLCSQGLGNSHVLSRSGANGLSLGSLLFLPKRRGNYSSALASWPSSATRQRGLGQGRRPAVDDPAILWVALQTRAGRRLSRSGPIHLHGPAPASLGGIGVLPSETCWTMLDCAHWRTPQSLAATVPHRFSRKQVRSQIRGAERCPLTM